MPCKTGVTGRQSLRRGYTPMYYTFVTDSSVHMGALEKKNWQVANLQSYVFW